MPWCALALSRLVFLKRYVARVLILLLLLTSWCARLHLNRDGLVEAWWRISVFRGKGFRPTGVGFHKKANTLARLRFPRKSLDKRYSMDFSTRDLYPIQVLVFEGNRMFQDVFNEVRSWERPRDGKGFGRPQPPLYSYKLPNMSEKSNCNSYNHVEPRWILSK